MGEKILFTIPYTGFVWAVGGGQTSYMAFTILSVIFTDSRLIKVAVNGNDRKYADDLFSNIPEMHQVLDRNSNILYMQLWYKLAALPTERQIRVGNMELSQDLLNAKDRPEYSNLGNGLLDRKPYFDLPYSKIKGVEIKELPSLNSYGASLVQIPIGKKICEVNLKGGIFNSTSFIMNDALRDQFRALIADTQLGPLTKD